MVAALDDVRSLATLLRWLGPWANDERKPTDIDRRDVPIGDFHGWLYTPRRRPHAAYLIAPGLHFLGPADQRIDRFCSILASAGFAVLAPFLPDYVGMKITDKVIADFESCLDWLQKWPELPGKPGLFSISFGSLPALRVAAERSADISHLVCFGGFASLDQTLEYCMTGEARDPLNQPAAFINLLDHIEGAPPDAHLVVEAWLAYMDRTWGRPEMKEPQRNAAVARDIANNLGDGLREFFLVGTGHRPGGFELAAPALQRMGEGAAFFDPRPFLHQVSCSVTIVHGRDDDVIPVDQAELLAAAFPDSADVSMIITGLYDHTRPASDIRMLASEGAGMLRILKAIGLGYRMQSA